MAVHQRARTCVYVCVCVCVCACVCVCVCVCVCSLAQVYLTLSDPAPVLEIPHFKMVSGAACLMWFYLYFAPGLASAHAGCDAVLCESFACHHPIFTDSHLTSTLHTGRSCLANDTDLSLCDDWAGRDCPLDLRCQETRCQVILPPSSSARLLNHAKNSGVAFPFVLAFFFGGGGSGSSKLLCRH